MFVTRGILKFSFLFFSFLFKIYLMSLASGQMSNMVDDEGYLTPFLSWKALWNRGRALLQPKRSPLGCCKVGQCHCEEKEHLGLTMWAGQTQMGSHTIPAVPSTWACSVASHASSPQCECSAFCVLIPKGTFLPACHVAMTSALATARVVHQPRNKRYYFITT